MQSPGYGTLELTNNENADPVPHGRVAQMLFAYDDTALTRCARSPIPFQDATRTPVYWHGSGKFRRFAACVEVAAWRYAKTSHSPGIPNLIGRRRRRRLA